MTTAGKSGRRPASGRAAATRAAGRVAAPRHTARRRPRPWEWRRILFVAALLLATLVALLADSGYLSQFDPIDVFVYKCYAHGFWQGQLPAHAVDTQSCAASWPAPPARFRAFPAEYPALALSIFSLPLLLPWLSYGAAYMVWIALILLLATGLLAWRGPAGVALALPLYVMLAGWGFVLQRFDLVLGLCVLFALLLARGGRARSAAVVLAIGTLLKLFPIVLLPVLLIACKRDGGHWRPDLVALFGAVCLAGVLPELALNAAGLRGSFAFLFGRPLELESLPGSLLWITSNLGAGPAAGSANGPYIAFSYNSLNVAGGAQSWWGTVWTLGGGAGLLGAYWRAWRGWDSLGRSVVLILLILLASGKVFSPQYILWVLPVAAVVEGVRLRWLLLAALVCAVMLGFYAASLQALAWTPLFLAAILARNLFVCALAVLYLATRGDRLSERWPARPLSRHLWPG